MLNVGAGCILKEKILGITIEEIFQDKYCDIRLEPPNYKRNPTEYIYQIEERMQNQ